MWLPVIAEFNDQGGLFYPSTLTQVSNRFKQVLEITVFDLTLAVISGLPRGKLVLLFILHDRSHIIGHTSQCITCPTDL